MAKKIVIACIDFQEAWLCILDQDEDVYEGIMDQIYPGDWRKYKETKEYGAIPERHRWLFAEIADEAIVETIREAIKHCGLNMWVALNRIMSTMISKLDEHGA